MEEVNYEQLTTFVIQDNPLLLVDFYSQDCGPCKLLTPILERESKRYPDVKFVKINVTLDHNKDVIQGASISSVPTVVIYKQGREMFRNAGIIDPLTLEKILIKKFNTNPVEIS